MPKMTIPAPGVLHFRQGRRSISWHPSIPISMPISTTWRTAYRKAVLAFYAAGCRYLQLDDTTWSMMCETSANSRTRASAATRRRRCPPPMRGMINRALKGQRRRPCGHHAFVPRQFSLDLDRRRAVTSRWPSGCSTKSGVDGYFLEYDSDRAGGFEPLRFFPKGKKQFVLGLVTSKNGALENKDDIKRRIDEAAKYVALDQLCLSPQCGFASTEEGKFCPRTSDGPSCG